MSYSTIDAVIKKWASDNKQVVLSQYKDCEVRSFEVFDDKGRKFQIWIDRPEGGFVDVHAWDYKKRRKDWRAPIGDLYSTLDEAFATVFQWP